MHETANATQASRAAAAAVGNWGAPKRTIIAAALHKLGEQAVHRIEAIQLTMDAATATEQVMDGDYEGAARTGLTTGERVAASVQGARLGLNTPWPEVTSPLGAIIGAWAPNALTPLNDAIVEFPDRLDQASEYYSGCLEICLE